MKPICAAMLVLFACGKGDKNDGAGKASKPELTEPGPAVSADEPKRPSESEGEPTDPWFDKFPEDDERKVDAPDGHFDPEFLGGPFKSLEEVCSLGREIIGADCKATELGKGLTKPINGFAVVTGSHETGRAVWFAVRTDTGWWLPHDNLARTGPFDGMHEAWAVNQVRAEGAHLRFSWTQVTAKLKGNKTSRPPSTAEVRLCGPKGDKDPACAGLFPEAVEGRERHVTVCGVGKSNRPSCTDVLVGVERGGKSLQLTMTPNKKGGVTIDAKVDTLEDTRLFSGRETRKFYFP